MKGNLCVGRGKLAELKNTRQSISGQNLLDRSWGRSLLPPRKGQEGAWATCPLPSGRRRNWVGPGKSSLRTLRSCHRVPVPLSLALLGPPATVVQALSPPPRQGELGEARARPLSLPAGGLSNSSVKGEGGAWIPFTLFPKLTIMAPTPTPPQLYTTLFSDLRNP